MLPRPRPRSPPGRQCGLTPAAVARPSYLCIAGRPGPVPRTPTRAPTASPAPLRHPSLPVPARTGETRQQAQLTRSWPGRAKPEPGVLWPLCPERDRHQTRADSAFRIRVTLLVTSRSVFRRARELSRNIRRYGRQPDLLLDLIHGDRTRRSVCGLQSRLASDSANRGRCPNAYSCIAWHISIEA